MAHRALVAYERPAGRYDVHTTRWGGLDCRLAESITPSEPYASGAVDPVPNVVARPFPDVLSMVDVARHEAIYRVSADYAVDTYLALWFGLDHYLGWPTLESPPEGLLVAVDTPAEASSLRAWFRAAKDTVAEAVRGGYLDSATARSVLADAVRQRAAGRQVLDPRRATGETDEY